MEFGLELVVVVVLAPWLLFAWSWLLLFQFETVVLCWLCCYCLCFGDCCYYHPPSCYLKHYFVPCWWPMGVFAPYQSLPKVLKFLLKKLWISANCFSLWMSVPMTLYLADRLWWLPHCKYRSVCVGLQYTEIERELSANGVTKVSRNGIAPFPWVPSIVNVIAGSMLLIWSRNASLQACCWMTHVYHTQGS